MPVRPLPSNPNLDHLKYQAKDLLKERAAHSPGAAQRIREFHPRFRRSADAEIFDAHLSLSDAQLTVAREYGFPSWARLKRHIEKPTVSDRLDLPHQQRIENPTFRRAVELVDKGDVAGLQAHLNQHPDLVHQHVVFEGGNYFQNPTLLEFVTENPVRHGTLPANIVEVTRVILDAGPSQFAKNETLMLVSTGSVPRECRAQLPLIDLLCHYGAEPNSAIQAAALHGELQAVNALLKRGAPIDLPVAASLGRIEDARRLLAAASSEDRHLALTLAADSGHVEVVRLLLDAGEDPNRYNPVGGHSHTTPLHQAAGRGHEEVVRLLVQRGARLDLQDILWRATPADWARHAGKTQIEAYLRR
ncbi:MAG TPA: ankyrin repeat domain-containing protein, partial [Candidatus Sulfotelmatobacter sp.]|nr:ankyrin repeat domain-containing protein [Candidatus Sulfotelmatobacter sp.]